MDLLRKVLQALFDKKGINIIAIDVSSFSSVIDYFVIAAGSVERHVQALAEHVIEAIKEEGVPILHTEGEREGDWIVIDQGDILIHVMTEELRERYRLEELWSAGKLVETDGMK